MPAEIAKVIGMSARHLRRIRREPGFAAAYCELRDAVFPQVARDVAQEKARRLRDGTRRTKSPPKACIRFETKWIDSTNGHWTGRLVTPE